MKTVLIIVLAMGLLLAGGRLFSRKLLYFPVALDSFRADQVAGLAARDPRIKSIEIEADDTTRLRGWVIEKEVQHLPFIFYFGGNAEEVSLNLEAFSEAVNANVVLVNYRGYGQSQGRPKEADLKADSLKIFDRLRDDYGLGPERCLAWGRSLGSSMACYLAAQRNLSGLILTCPFDSIQAVAALYYPGVLVDLVLTDPHLTLAFADQISSRTLILAAEHDEIIAFERTQTLYDHIDAAKEMEIIPKTGHNTISSGKGYYEIINRFLGPVESTGEKGGK